MGWCPTSEQEVATGKTDNLASARPHGAASEVLLLQGSCVIKKWESCCLCPPAFAAHHGAVRSWWLSLEQDDEPYLPSEMACKLCLLLKEDFAWRKGKALLIVAGWLEDGFFLEQFLAFTVWDGSGFCFLQLNPNFISLCLGVPSRWAPCKQPGSLSLQNVALVCLDLLGF